MNEILAKNCLNFGQKLPKSGLGKRGCFHTYAMHSSVSNSHPVTEFQIVKKTENGSARPGTDGHSKEYRCNALGEVAARAGVQWSADAV